MSEPGVLIVEHDDRVCRVLCRIIKRMGFEACPAADYEAFKTLYAREKPAIILLNMDSPDSDNSEFFRFLVEQQSQAAIILLSDLEEPETNDFMELGKAAGLQVGGVLRKPVDVEAVKRMLSGRAPKDPASPLKKSQYKRQRFHTDDCIKILDQDQIFEQRICLILT